MRMRLLIPALLLALPAPAVQHAALPAALPALQSSRKFDAALAAVRPDSIRADLYFLASDALAGRDTPSPELHIAANYLRNRVQRLGFQPGAEGGWFHEYPLHQRWFDGAASNLTARKGDAELVFEFGSDYYFQLGSDARDLELSGGVVCVDEADEDELAELELDGKWALILDTARTIKKKIKLCGEAGAAGVLVTPGPRYKRDSYAEKYQKRADSALTPSTPRLNKRRSRDEPATPVVMLTRDAAARLFRFAGVALEDEHPALGAALDVELSETRRVIDEQVPVNNVCAFWPGSDPELSKEVMIVSAHYDHVGTNKEGVIYNGADDNASGTCGVLAIADALAAHGPMRRSVLLIWVSGEEKGLWGSEVWTKDPWLPEDCVPVLDFNIDMIGRTGPDELYITPSRDHEAYNGVAERAYALAPLEGFAELQGQDEYWRRSDHMNFNDNLGIPVAFLSTGNHPDYHKPTDTPDKIEYEKASRVVRLFVRLLDDLQDAPLASLARQEAPESEEVDEPEPEEPEEIEDASTGDE